MNARSAICLIGFGEVGQTLAADLRDRGYSNLAAWDTLFDDDGSSPSRAAASGLAKASSSAGEALANAELVICAVTAAQCVDAARTAATYLSPNTYFVDLNSVAPNTKMLAAQIISDRGGRYVEAAVMAPIGPKRIATPMLLGGPHAADFESWALTLGFTGVRTFAADIGKASAAKMCRSVMIKGMEALVTESLLSARRYGVESTVLDSLSNLFPGVDWPKLGCYMISRSLQHGRRRAEEMREVAVTVRDAGIEPHMSLAIASRQDWAAAHASAAAIQPVEAMLDAILTEIPDPRST